MLNSIALEQRLDFRLERRKDTRIDHGIQQHREGERHPYRQAPFRSLQQHAGHAHRRSDERNHEAQGAPAVHPRKEPAAFQDELPLRLPDDRMIGKAHAHESSQSRPGNRNARRRQHGEEP
ncbi:MAG: hypothetical protein Q3963_05615, partial [Coriobacteriaceae bacterium]|nr:hypothetical protein [Coriobacteriaceae bacterium]